MATSIFTRQSREYAGGGGAGQARLGAGLHVTGQSLVTNKLQCPLPSGFAENKLNGKIDKRVLLVSTNSDRDERHVYKACARADG